MAIGRIGCFLINDHQGAITNLPWGIKWPDGAIRHPVALYLILFDLALAGFLWWQNRNFIPFFNKKETGKSNPNSQNFFQSFLTSGNQFLIFLFLYSVGRFFLDFTRAALADPHYWGLSVSQWLSILIMAVVSVLFIKKRKATKFILSNTTRWQ